MHPARQGFPPPIQIGMPGSNLVNEAASAIVGAGTPFLYHVDLSDEPEPIPTHLYYKSSKPIAARVPQKIKDRICADQFVDLASLTDANMGAETTVSGYVPVGGGFYKPISKRKASQITNIAQWVKAFHTFIAIYSKAHPEEASNLMKYLTLVESIAKEGGDWLMYDETFRYERASLPVTGRCPWEKMDQELYTRSMLRIGTMPRGIGLARAGEVSWNGVSSGSGLGGRLRNMAEGQEGWAFQGQGISRYWPGKEGKQGFTNQTNGSRWSQNDDARGGQGYSSRKFPVGSCWKFHNSGYCGKPGCQFTHACTKCGGEHSTNSCRGH